MADRPSIAAGNINIPAEDLHLLTPREMALYAYAKYRGYQTRVDRIESRALARYRHNSTVAKYMLKTGEDYWKYRELCGTRDYWEGEARLAATLAGMVMSA
jgi:hypothetical protein